MSLESVAIPNFAGHQTFHPRFGWLKKGYDQAAKDPAVFLSPDATVRLGVGKNMVEAIRFWTLATGVLCKIADPVRPRVSIAVPSRMGRNLFSDNGFDPFCEDPTTLWILHWLTCSPPNALPVWCLTFSDLTSLEFDDIQLEEFCFSRVSDSRWATPQRATLKKDVDCLLRMYSSRGPRARQSLDDLLDSPFRELGVLSSDPGEAGRYRFVRGWKPTLTTTAILYACLDFLARVEPDSQTASVSRLAGDPYSPGRIFKLSEANITDAIEQAAASVVGVQLASPGGVSQLLLSEPAARTAVNLFAQHLISAGRDPRLILGADLVGPAARMPVTRS